MNQTKLAVEYGNLLGPVKIMGALGISRTTFNSLVVRFGIEGIPVGDGSARTHKKYRLNDFIEVLGSKKRF